MFCPQCGQRQAANDVRFCSACGFHLHIVSQLLATRGNPPTLAQSEPRALSPRQKGIRQGAMIMLSTLFIVPLVAIIGVALLDLPGEIAGVASITCFMGGLLRILYALLLEEKDAPVASVERKDLYSPPNARTYMNASSARAAELPPQRSVPASAYVPPKSADTGELAQPPSVTENTTKLLKDPPDGPSSKDKARREE